MSERGQGWRGRRARASFCVCSSRMSGGAAVHYKPVACHDRRDRRCATSAADHADHADYADHVDLNPGVAWQLRSLPFWGASATAHDGNLLMSRVHALSAAICLSILLAACGGGGGTSPGTGRTPPPPPPPGPVNPCTTALAASVPAASVIDGAPHTDKKALIDGNPRGRLPEAIALNRWADDRRRHEQIRAAVEAASRGEQQTAVTAPAPVAEDAGEIAVLQDTGDLILPLNPLDLRSIGLRFTRNGSGYTASKIDATFRPTLGTKLTLTDDDSTEVDIPFPFPFYGTAQTAAFVNSDGNITLGEGDKASTERNLGRLITGAPRIAPFFTDLDPTTGTGKIFVNAATDQYSVTWCDVRGFDSTRTTTVQVTLLPDGSVEMKFGDAINVGDSIVGLSPGHAAAIALVDLDTGNGAGAGAIAARFAQANSIDTLAVAKKFYATHPDSFDQILLWTDQPLIRDAFAYELTVANEVRGIGQEIFDTSRLGASAWRRRPLVVLYYLAKYPDDPGQKFLGENNTLSVLGQEVGHRWLAYLEFKDRTGTRSPALRPRPTAPVSPPRPTPHERSDRPSSMWSPTGARRTPRRWRSSTRSVRNGRRPSCRPRRTR